MTAGQAAGLRPSAAPPTRGELVEARAGRVIAIASGKGGVGKSSIAAALGVTLAARGCRTLLVDADLGLASLDLALGVRPERTVLDVLRRGLPAEDAIVEGPCGVRLLPAAPGRADMASLGALERTRVRETIDELAASHDLVLVDAGAGIGPTAIELAAAADDVLVVVTPDVTSIRHAYATIKTLAQRGARRLALIVNQHETSADASRIASHLVDLSRRFLELPLRVVGSIPRDPCVPAGLATSVPFALRTPSAAASRALLAITDLVDPRERC